MDRTALAENHLRTLDALGVDDYQLLLQQIADEALTVIIDEAHTEIRYNGEQITLAYRLYGNGGIDAEGVRRVRGKMHALSADLRRLIVFVRIEQANRRLIGSNDLTTRSVAEHQIRVLRAKLLALTEAA